MNVTFKVGEVVFGTWKCVDVNGLSRFVFENIGSGNRIVLDSDAGEGVNYSKVVGYYDRRTGRSYSAMIPS